MLFALGVNVSEVKKEMMMLTQAETNYNAAGGKVNKACSNCRWFCPADDMQEACCHLVEDDPAPMVSNGLCDRWEAVPMPAVDPVEALAEAVTEAVETMAEVTYTMEVSDEPKLIERVWNSIKTRLQGTKQDSAFSVFKGTDNEWHWHAVFTNNFEDLEQEIISEKAHENYVNRVDMGLIPMPELWAWHTVGTKHGQVDSVWYNNHFMHAVGHFDNTPDAQKAIAFYRKNKVKLSHGFTSPVWAFKDGIYEDYNTFEITTLPPYAAANPYTSFEEFKEMALTEDKRRYISEALGKDKLAEIEAADEQRGKALESLNITYKDFAATTPAAEVETDKSLADMYLELSQGLGDVVQVMTLQTKAIQAKDAQITALEKKFDDETAAWLKELNDLRTLVNQGPRRASQDASTLLTDKDKDVLKDKLPNGDALSQMFPGMIKAGA